MSTATEPMTEQERENLELAHEYMRISYTPGLSSRKAVAHLCAASNSCIAPTTFPNAHTLEDYADDHGALMEQLDDLHIVDFDVIFARGDRVAIRYTAEGTHKAKPHGDIAPTGRKARWTAAALFRAEGGKLTEFIKEWDKLSMWEQLGWPLEECRSHTLGSSVERGASAVTSAIEKVVS